MKRELELYLHIPFCIQKCAYCDFLSAPSDAALRQQYVGALITEIENSREVCADYVVPTVFIGGGTPSILTGRQIEDILAAVYRSFCVDSTVEITIEMNPGTGTEEKLDRWKAAGINRLSIGLQSMDNEELKRLGRIHTAEQFLRAYDGARKAGFTNINIDLMSAIPGQTFESFLHTLELTVRLCPEHISAYSLIIEEGTPFYEQFHRGALKLPDEEEERLMYEETEKVLKKHNYNRYEISNYARPGYECRHNLGYWERKEYLGLGLGAASLMEHSRFSNTDHLQAYMKAMESGKKAVREKEQLSAQAEMEEFMFLGLRKIEGVMTERFELLAGRDIHSVYGEVLARLMNEKLLEEADGNIRLTKRGIDISNYVLAQFLL